MARGCFTSVSNAVDQILAFLDDPLNAIATLIGAVPDLIALLLYSPSQLLTEVLADLLKVDVLEAIDQDDIDASIAVAEWKGEVLCDVVLAFLSPLSAASVVFRSAGLARGFLTRLDNGEFDDIGRNLPCNNSFPGETQVLMADGSYERIDEIRPGDYVISFNFDTSVWEPKLVVDQWSHPERGPPVTVTLADQSTVTATDDHLFWVESSQDWIELDEVQSGDVLLTPHGEVTVDDVTVGADGVTWTVWDFTVEDNHNFTVSTGSSNVLVHNAPCRPDGYSGRPLEDLLPGNVMPTRQGNPSFATWWNNLSLEELNYLFTDGSLITRMGSRIRGDAGVHEWCMCSQAPKFKEWGVTMEQILAFTTKTYLVRGETTPLRDPWDKAYDPTWAGQPWQHPTTGVSNSSASARFHIELGHLIETSRTLTDYNQGLPGLMSRWGMDPDILPPFPTP